MTEANKLDLNLSLASSILPVTGQPRKVYLLVDVSGGEGAPTLPSNLGFVLDTSDSMRIRLVTDAQFIELAKNGLAQEVMTDGVPAYQIKAISDDLVAKFPRRIDYAAEALRIAGEYLRSADYFSVVAFAGRAHCIIPSSPGKEKGRLQQAVRELEFMRLGDETQMAQGIALPDEPPARGAGMGPGGGGMGPGGGGMGSPYRWGKHGASGLHDRVLGGRDSGEAAGGAEW